MLRTSAHALLVRWRAAPTLPLLQEILTRVREVARASGRPIAFVMEHDASVGAPAAEFRRGSVEAVEAVGESIACLAFVLRTSGLRASMLRSAMTGIVFLARPRFPARVFASLNEEAQNWIVAQVGGSAQEQEGLRASLRELEASYAADGHTARH